MLTRATGGRHQQSKHSGVVVVVVVVTLATGGRQYNMQGVAGLIPATGGHQQIMGRAVATDDPHQWLHARQIVNQVQGDR